MSAGTDPSRPKKKPRATTEQAEQDKHIARETGNTLNSSSLTGGPIPRLAHGPIQVQVRPLGGDRYRVNVFVGT